MPEFTHIVLHYDEIGLKSTNRGQFEQRLLENARRKSKPFVREIRREAGQLTAELRTPDVVDDAVDVLRRVPGIAHLAPAVQTEPTLEALTVTAVELVRELNYQTFRVDCRRHDKRLPFDSMEVNRAIGTAIQAAYPDKGVRMKGWDLCVKLGVNQKRAYVSAGDLPGVGGLPTDSRQRVVALLSGGLDSPVAAYLMMKRGCEVVLVHFQNANQMTNSVEDKIQRLAEQLSRYQVKTRLFIVPFGELQNEIIKHVPAKRRMLVYRRIMILLAARIARTHKAKFLAMGDSLSQVASQTYDNLHATFADAPMHVLTPLIGMDKREITAITRIIGTFEISSLQYEDCCSYYMPKHPELRATPEMLAEHVAALDLEPLAAAALAQACALTWK